MTWTASLAELMGAEESALKLLLAQLFGHPVMMVHRLAIKNLSCTMQHIYFALTGILTGYWFIGFDVFHNLAAVFGTYIILALLGGSMLSVILVLTFNVGYLLTGYWFTETDSYLIGWTMPGCILCLRLIGLGWDCYDGAKISQNSDNSLSKDQQKAALSEAPSLLEMLSHSFFLGGYLIGPQFTMKKYRDYASPGFIDALPGTPYAYAIKRLLLGVLYMTLLQIGVGYLPSDWPDTQSFYETSFAMKLVLLPIWVKVCLCKYLSLWLFGESVCALSGLGYNGKGEDGSIDWSGCKNVSIIRLETASRFQHIIDGFNINTNQWAASYIYKRLKFMNNRLLSQTVTLFFLAIWHGYHIGYFLTFFNEFLVIYIDKMWMSLLDRSEWMEHPGANSVTKVLGYLYVHLLLPHCFIPFSLFSATKFIRSYQGTYFVFYVFILLFPLLVKVVKPMMRLKARHKKE